MKDLFKRTMLDIDMYSAILKTVAQRSLELGVDEEKLTVQVAHQKTNAALKDYIKKEKEARSMGYKSLGVAWKAFKMMANKQPDVDISSLPEVFHKPPAIWLTGKPANKARGEKGFAPLRVREAELQHKGVLPWLLEAWAMTNDYENGEEVRTELHRNYLTTTPDTFERLCYMWINNMEEPLLEEEFTNQVDLSPSLLETTQALRSVTSLDYGVGGELESPQWD